MLCVLGPVTFEALGSPQVIDSSRGWQYAEHKTIESTPKLQWVGDALEELTLEILLHVSFAQPAADRAALYAAAESHQALPLVFGTGEHRGYFVIAKIAETAHKLADDGSPIAITMKLELKAWAQSVELDPEAPPIPATPPPALIVGPLAPGAKVAGVAAATTPTGGVTALAESPLPVAPPSAVFEPDLVPTQEVCRMDPDAGAILQ